MNTVKIKEPIWSNNSIGIKASDLTKIGVLVEITYRTKHGERLFPSVYLARREKVLKCPTMRLKYDTEVHIVPINQLEIWKDGKEDSERG